MILVGFLFGIFFEAFREEGKLFLCMVVFACAMMFPFYFFRKGRGRFFVLFLWVIIGMVFGGTRYFVSEMVFDDDVRYLNGGGAVRFEACISEEPDVRSDKSKYIVSGVRVGDLSFDGDVLVSASKYPIYEYGDVVEVFGGFEEPGVVDGFEYDKYLAVKGIYSIVNSSSIRLLGRVWLGCGNFFMKWIYKFKFGLNDRIFKLFPEPHAGFISGLLLGMRSGISRDLSDDFKETGLTHIIAISGYNITLVIIAVSALFSFLKRKLKVIFAGIFIVLFVILVGGGSSVVRAAIMGILGLFAVYSGRSRDIFAVLLFSAFAMNLWNPKLIVFDTGFQLSFLATMGLIYVSPKLKNFSLRIPAAFAIRENFTMTLSAQAFALPVILKAFGRISLICPIANILILPFIPFVMIFGFLAAVLNSSVVAFFCYVILDVVFFLVRIFADLSRTL